MPWPYTKLTALIMPVLPESNGALAAGWRSKPPSNPGSKGTQRASKSSSQSVDGMTETTPRLSASPANSSYRNTFVNNLVICRSISGSTVWISIGNTPTPARSQNFRLLMQQLAATFHPRGKLVAAAVTADDSVGSVDAEVIKAVDS